MTNRGSPFPLCAWTILAALLLVLGTGPAATARDRVQPLRDAQLPIAGTCAPTQTEDLTYLTVGELGWYRVQGAAEEMNYRGLVDLLRQRAGSSRPSPHAVWIRATGGHLWAHVFAVRNACQQAGIYRVGVMVRSEQGGRPLGFPLFLPPGVESGSRPGVSANRLPIAVDAVDKRAGIAGAANPMGVAPTTGRGPADAGRPEFRGGVPLFMGFPERARGAREPSDVRFLYSVSKAAIERWGPTVAEVNIANNIPLQYAISTLDMLYRGGCAGIRVRSGTILPNLEAAVTARVRVVRAPRAADYEVPPPPLDIDVPSIEPRAEPWGLHGANQPGALSWQLRQLPVQGETAPTVSDDTKRLWPNYSRAGQVPPAVREDVAARIRTWRRELGAALLAGLRGEPGVEERLAVRLRSEDKRTDLLAPARRAFPDADQVVPTTIRLDAYFFQGGTPVAHADVTVSIGANRISLVFARPTDARLPAELVLPPEAVDDFAAGLPGALRVWLEAVFLDARRAGTNGIPMTPEAVVLAGLPGVAHGQVRPALAARPADFARLAGLVAGLRYDRIYLLPRDASAAVASKRRVIGVLRYGLTPEEKELRITRLRAHRAR